MEPPRQKRKMRWFFCVQVFLFVVGIICLVSFAVMGIIWSSLMTSLFSTQLALTTSSMSYSMWEDIPLPMYFDIYMWNWTNPQDSIKYNNRPFFKEMGPYVFRLYETKEKLVWNDNNTVTFNQKRIWKFQPEMSQGTLDDNVTNVNVVAVTLGNIIKTLVPESEAFVLKLINTIIKSEEDLYITKSVQQLIFDGYYDRFLNISNDLKQYIKIDLPFDKFGWLYGRNASSDYDGVFNMYTGQDNLRKLGNLHAWNYKSQLSFFNGTCGKVKGNTGELMPKGAADQESLELFISDICSSMKLTRNSSTTYYGLSGATFVGDGGTFDNSKPQSKCYCLQKPCQPPGTRDLSTCRYQAPAFVSFPHFYLADPYYSEQIGGMDPSEEKHRLTLSVEKTTNVPLAVNARLQINVKTGPIKGLPFYASLPKAYMPQIWFDQHTEITSSLAGKLSVLVVFYDYGVTIFSCLAVFGFILAAIGAFLWARERWELRRKPLLDSSGFTSLN